MIVFEPVLGNLVRLGLEFWHPSSADPWVFAEYFDSCRYLSFNPSGYSSRKTTHDISATKVTSPNTALTAFVQLVALRLNAQRAIISLVDRDNQVRSLR